MAISKLFFGSAIHIPGIDPIQTPEQQLRTKIHKHITLNSNNPDLKWDDTGIDKELHIDLLHVIHKLDLMGWQQ